MRTARSPSREADSTVEVGARHEGTPSPAVEAAERERPSAGISDLATHERRARTLGHTIDKAASHPRSSGGGDAVQLMSWRRAAKYGLFGLAGAIGGIATAPAWAGAAAGATAGGLLGLGLSRLHDHFTAPRNRLDFTANEDSFGELQEAMGHDPNVQLDRRTRRVTSTYGAQQLMEQYPSAAWQAPVSNQIEGQPGGNRRQIPPEAGLRRQIDAAFSPPGEFERQEQERAALLHRASGRVNNFDYHALDAERTPAAIGRDRDDLRDHGVGALLDRHPGVAFGEGHGDPVNKEFITQNMGQFRHSGVNTLYMEHFRDDHQAHLDEYLASPHARMPPELDRYINNQDQIRNPHRTSLRDMVTTARTHGMRIRGIDTQAASSPDGGGEGGKALREANMNQFGEETIRADARARGQGKYVILTGAAHNNTQPATAYGQARGLQHGAPGFSQLLRIPAVTAGAHGPTLDEENIHNRA